MNKPKILFIDIETRPAVAYTWGLWNVNIGVDQVIDNGGMICFGAKWLGSKDMIFYSDWEHGHERMVEAARELLFEADAVVTYNGDHFDIPKLNGEFLAAGLTPPPPPTSIDVYKTVKKLGLISGKLAFVGPFLKVGAKVKHEGFKLWTSVLAGDVKAQAKMERYCAQDVKLLEVVYKRILPFIKNHPHLGEEGPRTCGACGSKHIQSRGYYRTKNFKTQRVQCQSCGSWSTGKRTKIS